MKKVSGSVSQCLSFFFFSTSCEKGLLPAGLPPTMEERGGEKSVGVTGLGGGVSSSVLSCLVKVRVGKTLGSLGYLKGSFFFFANPWKLILSFFPKPISLVAVVSTLL